MIRLIFLFSKDDICEHQFQTPHIPLNAIHDAQASDGGINL